MPGKNKSGAKESGRGMFGRLPDMGGGVLFVLAVYGASRLFYLVAGALFAAYLPMGLFFYRTLDVPPGRLNYWAHWDGVWYSHIAAEGYGTAEWGPPLPLEAYETTASTAFFPLYPLLVRSFAGLFGGPISLGAISVYGVLVSLAALPFALYFIYRIAEHGWGTRVAQGAVLLLAFFPTSYFLNAAYTESLFLALSAGSLWALRLRRDLLLACAFAAFATATRNVGVFLLVPLAWEWYRDRDYYGWRGIYLGLAPCGLVAYMGYLWARFGNPILFYEAQGYWSREPTPPWAFAIHIMREAGESVGALFTIQPSGNLTLAGLLERLNSMNDASNLLFLVFTAAMLVIGLRVLPPSLSVYAFLLVIPAALFGKAETPLIGFPRYLLAAFPIYIVLATLLVNRRAFGIWLAASAVFSLILCALFVSWRFTA